MLHHKNSSDSNSNYDPVFASFENNFENNNTNGLELSLHTHANHLNIPFKILEMLDAMSNCNSKSPGPDDYHTFFY